MTATEIIGALHPDNKRVREAFAEAVRQKEAVTPALLAILQEAVADIYKAIDMERFDFIAAAYLLAEFHEQKAFPALIDLMRVHNDADMFNVLWGDMFDDYCALLRDTYDGNYKLLREIIENENYFVWMRAEAVGAYSWLLADGHITRRELVRYLRHLLRHVYTEDKIRCVFEMGDEDRYDDMCYIAAQIAWAVTENKLIEMIDDLRPFFETTIVDETYYGTYGDFLKFVNGDGPNFRDNRRITSAAEELSFWWE